MFAIFVPLALLVLFEPDYDSVMVLAFIAITMLIVSGVPCRVLGGMGLVIGPIGLVMSLLKSYRVDRMLAFDWRYETQDMSSSFDVFGYTVDGVFTQLSQDGLSFLDVQSGRQSLSLAAGSRFAWSLRSVDSEGGSAVVRLSGLSAQAVAPVPEPSIRTGAEAMSLVLLDVLAKK